MVKTFTKQIDGHTVSMDCDDHLEAQTEAVFSIMEQQNQKTPLFKETCMIRIGWCVYQITKPDQEDGVYRILCPDFKNDPLKGKMEDLTTAIAVQDMIMRVMLNAKINRIESPLFYDFVTVSQAVMPGKEIVMTRMETKKQGDSGWTIVLADPDEEEKKKPMVNVLICHLLKLNSLIMGFIALPAGTKITSFENQKKFHIDRGDFNRNGVRELVEE